MLTTRFLKSPVRQRGAEMEETSAVIGVFILSVTVGVAIVARVLGLRLRPDAV